MTNKQKGDHTETYRIYFEHGGWVMKLKRDGQWTTISGLPSQDAAWAALKEERTRLPCPA